MSTRTLFTTSQGFTSTMGRAIWWGDTGSKWWAMASRTALPLMFRKLRIGSSRTRGPPPGGTAASSRSGGARTSAGSKAARSRGSFKARATARPLARVCDSEQKASSVSQFVNFTGGSVVLVPICCHLQSLVALKLADLCPFCAASLWTEDLSCS
jgi:hypothetical protein